MEDIIRKKIINIIKGNCDYTNSKIIEEKEPLGNLGVNSMTFMKIVIDLELEFDFEFIDEDLQFSRFVDIKSLVDYVKANVLEGIY